MKCDYITRNMWQTVWWDLIFSFKPYLYYLYNTNLTSVYTSINISNPNVYEKGLGGKKFWEEVDDVVYELCKYNGLSLMMCFEHFQPGREGLSRQKLTLPDRQYRDNNVQSRKPDWDTSMSRTVPRICFASNKRWFFMA